MRARSLTLIIVATVVAAALSAVWWFRSGPSGDPIRVGVLHSLTGPLAVSEKPLIEAYRLAVDEINDAGGVLGRPLELVIRDGASDPESFAAEADRMLSDRDGGAVDVIAGCWSSASRKALLPVLDRHDGLLLYPVQFEGLEVSPNVVYLGAVPNQQIGPAIEWAMDQGAKRVFLVGSDYVFPHAANAVVRDQVEARGGTIVGEMYMPLSGGDPRQVAERATAAKPDLIVNTVNGESNQGLLQALRTVGIDPATTMLISFSISESDVRAWGPRLFEHTILSGSYYRGLQLDANQRFLDALRRSAGPEVFAGDALVSAYNGLHLWARAVTEAGNTRSEAVRRAIGGRHVAGPGGVFLIDPEICYTWTPIRLGRVRADGGIDIIWDSDGTVRPRAWPVWRTREQWEEMLRDMNRRWGGKWEAPATQTLKPATRSAAESTPRNEQP